MNDVADAVVIVDVARGDGPRTEASRPDTPRSDAPRSQVAHDDRRIDVVVALVVGDERHPVTTWSADGPADRAPAVVVARSPDRCSVAVVVDAELSCVDLRDGTRSVVGQDRPWSADGEGAVAWEDGRPRIVPVEADGPRRLPLADGRALVLDAAVSCDDGFSGGDQGSMAGVAMPLGTSPEAVDRARDELHAALDDEALLERRAWVRLEGPHAPAVVLDEVQSGAYGSPNVHWPVSVGPSGVLIRTSTTRFTGVAAPELSSPDPPSNPDDRPWLTAARVTADEQSVVLLLAEVPWIPFWDPDVDVGWAVVRLSADGRGAPVLLAEGRRTPRRFSAIAL